MTDLEEKAEEYANEIFKGNDKDSLYYRTILIKGYKDGYAQGQQDMPYTSKQVSENGRLKLENAELKAQIEKMRNCPNCNKKGCNLEIIKRKECIDNNNSLWEWELAE